MMSPKNNQGQGLMELIIAVGIIAASVVGTVTLILFTQQASRASKSIVLASNLAREGIEVVRGIRDSAWLAIDSGTRSSSDWSQDFFPSNQLGAPDYSATASFIPTTGEWQLEFDADVITDEDAVMYFNPVTGVFSQFNSDVPPSFQSISYWRLLFLDPICWDMNALNPETTETIVSTEGVACPAGKETVGLRVRSKVRWLDRGQIQNTEVVDKLYNWKA